MNGYTGKILRVNLEKKTIVKDIIFISIKKFVLFKNELFSCNVHILCTIAIFFDKKHNLYVDKIFIICYIENKKRLS